MRALGLIETIGLVGAIEGLDAALKAANVEAIGMEFVGAGIVTVKIRGEVGAVKASIESAEAAVSRVGTLRTTHVIARTYEELDCLIENTNEVALVEEKVAEEVVIEEVEDKSEEVIVEEVIEQEVSKELEVVTETEEKLEDIDNEETEEEIVDEQASKDYSKDELQTMKVSELRTVARTLGTKLTRKKIKFAKKDELIEAILEVVER